MDLAGRGLEPFVDVNGGVRVFPASGGMFNADASQPSGLEQYVLGDMVFTQKTGFLPERAGVGVVEYAFSLTYTGGGTEYFNAAGDLVTRVDVFGARADWVWAEGHRLVRIIDGGGSRAQVMWTETGVDVFAPERSDGIRAKTVLEVLGGRLISVTDPVEQQVAFQYEDAGLLDRVTSPSASVTDVTYQQLPDGNMAVDRIRIFDSETDTQLSMREWDIAGDGRTAEGWPDYNGAGALWASGDGEFRYQTQLSNEATRVVSEYNAMGLMLSQKVILSSPYGDVVVQEHHSVFPGTEAGGVPDPRVLPKQYAKPTQSRVVFRDARGTTREVSESMVFDEAGRMIEHVSTDGARTKTTYDNTVADGMVLPVGLMVEETITGRDGVVSKTVNTLTNDRKAVAATETFIGTTTSELVSKARTEFTVASDGFISEQRIQATADLSEGPRTVITRFTRAIDNNAGTVSVSQTDAADTPAASTAITVTDKPTGVTLSETDATGRVSTTRYDAANRILNHTDLAGLVTTTEYGHNVVRTTDPMGIVRSEYVDVLGQVIRVADNIKDGAPVAGFERVVEKRKYEQNSSKVTFTDGRGLETIKVSDVFGRPREVITPSGVRHITDYDDVAHTVSTGVVAGGESGTPSEGLAGALRVSHTQMDDANRAVAVKESRSDGVFIPDSTTTYDGLGRVTEHVAGDVSIKMVLNPDGTPKVSTLTPLQPDIFVGNQVTANREHDLLGVPTKKTLTQAGGVSREGVSRVLDAAGQVVSETNQAGQYTTYEYTADGLVSQLRQEATGIVVRNTYDPLSRALTGIETIARDGTVSAKELEYDPLTGHEIAVFDPTQKDATVIRYEYDVLGNRIKTSYPDGKTLLNTFDDFGTKTTSTDIAGNITKYAYDRTGLITGLTQTSFDNTLLGQVAYEYDALGRMVKLSRGNNMVTQYTFTSADQIKTETTTRDGAVIVDARYEYDAHGNLSKRVDTRPHEVDTTTCSSHGRCLQCELK